MIVRSIREHGIANFAQVILAFEAGGTTPGGEEHGDEDGDEHPDDGDDDQQLNEDGGARMGSWSAHRDFFLAGLHLTIFSRVRHGNISL